MRVSVVFNGLLKLLVCGCPVFGETIFGHPHVIILY